MPLGTFEVRSAVLCVAALPDGVHFVVGIGYIGEVKLYHVDGTLVHTFMGHANSVWSVAVTLDGHHIISGSADNLVKVWSVASKSLVSDCTGHADRVNAVAAMPTASASSAARTTCPSAWLLDGTLKNTFGSQQCGGHGAARQPARALRLDRPHRQAFNVNDRAVLRTFKYHEHWWAPSRCCPTAFVSSAARPTPPPASSTTAWRRTRERFNLNYLPEPDS